VQKLRQGVRIKAARYLRRNLTKPELWLWLRLEQREPNGLVFRNQHPLGPYVLDFYCAKAKLCVEVDGEIHTHDHQRKHDATRDQWLSERHIFTYRIIARDLLMSPDEAAEGVINLAWERVEMLKAPPTA
jgi:very-short-patch-repair endonuclease